MNVDSDNCSTLARNPALKRARHHCARLCRLGDTESASENAPSRPTPVGRDGDKPPPPKKNDQNRSIRALAAGLMGEPADEHGAPMSAPYAAGYVEP
jgi:hypothetical protein